MVTSQASHSGSHAGPSILIFDQRHADPAILHREVPTAVVIREVGPTVDGQLALCGIDRHPPSEPTPGLWSNAVALVDVVKGEAGAPNQGYGITGEMTAIGHPALERFQATLPHCHASIRRKAVFEEVESASWTEHS